MRASLTFPIQAKLLLGDNPIYIGNLNRGQSTTVNWTITFLESGIFTLDVNASGYSVSTGEYTEIHGPATVTIVEPPPPTMAGGAPRVNPLMK